MAERKRGLGRGIGALIPDVVTDERPVDVFFPDGGRDVDGADDSPRKRAAKTADPSEGMRRAAAQKKHAKKPTAKSAGKGETKSPDTKTETKAAEQAGTTTTRGRVDSKTGPEVGAGSGAETGDAADKTATRPSVQKRTRGTAASKVVEEKQSAASAAAHSPSADTDVDGSELRQVPGTAFGLLPLEQIRANPRQPRTVFDEDALAELVHSISEVGVLQPVVVRVVDLKKPQYELIMGERRFRASQEAGLTEIPAIIREVRDDDLLRDALLENLHRADLNPLEEAAAYQQLLDDFACTQEELSERIGRSRPQITNTLRLLRLPALVQRRVAAGVISQGHARALLGLNDTAQMEVVAQRIVAEGLSVRATEEAVVLLNRGEAPKPRRSAPGGHPELDAIAGSIGDRLDTRVAISMGKRKGKISVEFANQDDLDRILRLLGVQKQE